MIQYTKLAHCIVVIIIIIAFTEGECEGKSLEDLLVFSTGASSIPPLGFECKPQLVFTHPQDLAMDDYSRLPRVFPHANT
jgi:hypothetical protein